MMPCMMVRGKEMGMGDKRLLLHQGGFRGKRNETHQGILRVLHGGKRGII